MHKQLTVYIKWDEIEMKYNISCKSLNFKDEFLLIVICMFIIKNILSPFCWYYRKQSFQMSCIWLFCWL